VAALAYRYRDLLADLFGRDSRTTPATESRPTAERWPGTTPEHDVDRAWVELIRRLNPNRPETTTPDECRALARVRGVDRDAVESIVSRVRARALRRTLGRRGGRPGSRRLRALEDDVK